MHIQDVYSHLNGEEYLIVHQTQLYENIRALITEVEASKLMTKISREKTMRGKRLYSPRRLNDEFGRLFRSQGWESVTYHYYITTCRRYLDRIVNLPPDEQKAFLQQHGISDPMKSLKQTDFVKDKVAVEVQFGKYAFVAYDLFVKHLLFYSGGVINVGVEILPMKAMLTSTDGGRTMSTGIAYFEGEVYNIMRHGRNNPPVPLVIIGIAP